MQDRGEIYTYKTRSALHITISHSLARFSIDLRMVWFKIDKKREEENTKHTF